MVRCDGTEEHPEYSATVKQAKNEKRRRLAHAEHMRGLELHNMSCWYDSEVKMANETFEVSQE